MNREEIQLQETRIIFGKGILNSELIFEFTQGVSSVVIISDSNVAPLYAKQLVDRYKDKGFDTHLLVVDAGEQSKSRKNKEYLEDQMLNLGLGRDTLICALGGGVITDLAAFVASTYCRGIPLLLLPTSLLAMVDASIGGKTGVNTPQGKNLIGTFYQPIGIILDIDVLKTLSKEELLSGSVEMIKHGLVLDEPLVVFLEKKGLDLFSDEKALFESIVKSCQIKCDVVLKDEKESGYRRIVNYGHTVGHAIEAISKYSKVNHGQAVAMGMVAEGFIAKELGLLEESDLNRMIAILKQYQVLQPLDSAYDLNVLLDLMQQDKKAKGKKARFTLLKKIGETESFHGEYCREASDDLILQSLHFIAKI